MTQTRATTDDGQQESQAMVPASERQLAQYNAEVLDATPGLKETFLLMVADVPEPGDDAAEATASMIGTILGAEDPEDLDKPFDSDGMRHKIGQVVTVNAITRRPSDYEGGLGVYLGCDCTTHPDGERLFISCGSAMCVAQLVRAHALKAFPLVVVPTSKDKPTKAGYKPYHFRVFPSAEAAEYTLRAEAERKR